MELSPVCLLLLTITGFLACLTSACDEVSYAPEALLSLNGGVGSTFLLERQELMSSNLFGYFVVGFFLLRFFTCTH